MGEPFGVGFCNGGNWVCDHGGGARGTATASGDGRIEHTVCRTRAQSGIGNCFRRADLAVVRRIGKILRYAKLVAGSTRGCWLLRWDKGPNLQGLAAARDRRRKTRDKGIHGPSVLFCERHARFAAPGEESCQCRRFPGQEKNVGPGVFYITPSLSRIITRLRGFTVVTKLQRLTMMMSMRSRSVRMIANLSNECEGDFMEKNINHNLR